MGVSVVSVLFHTLRFFLSAVRYPAVCCLRATLSAIMALFNRDASWMFRPGAAESKAAFLFICHGPRLSETLIS